MLTIISLDSSKETISHACKTGAFYYKTSISQQSCIQEAKKIFNLSLDKFTFNSTRGYIPFGKESGGKAYESKEAYSYGYPNDQKNKNIWPNEEIKQFQESFYKQMVNTALEILKLLSISLGKDKDYLYKYCANGDQISLMRVFHYLSLEKTNKSQIGSKDITGSNEHTDWGFLTLILAENDRKGLEIYDKGKWIEIPPLEGHLIVNLGDYFSLLTNGQYTSPLHRVVLDPLHDRYSYVFFFYPDFDAKIPIFSNNNQANLCILKNQTENGGEVKDLGNETFGEWILKKWEQVSRTGEYS